MSHQAQEHVLSLTGISRRQKFLLLIIAFHHQAHRQTYWPSHETLAAEAMCDTREVRRMIQQCRALGVLSVTPGRGQGNASEYGFPGMEKRVNIPSFEGAKEGTKEGIFTRPKKELQTQLQNQTPLYPPKGGTITPRDLKRLKERVDYWATDKHSGRDGILASDDPRRHDAKPLMQAIEIACRELLIPFESAVVAFSHAGYNMTQALAEWMVGKKPPSGVAS